MGFRYGILHVHSFALWLVPSSLTRTITFPQDSRRSMAPKPSDSFSSVKIWSYMTGVIFPGASSLR